MVAPNRLSSGVNYGEYAECDLPADLELAPEVALRLRLYCFHRGLDAQTWTRVEVALVEGLNNAIEHGCRGVSQARIRVRWSWTDEMLEIQILDPGKFRPGPAAAQLPEELAEHGRGMFLMSSLMDSVRHELLEGGHALVLRLRLGPIAAPPNDAETTLEAMTAELGIAFETITALFRFGEELATARSFDEFAEEVLGQLIKLVHADESWLRLSEPGTGLRLVDPRPAPRPTPLPELLGREHGGIETQAFRDAEPQTVEDCSALAPSDPLYRERGSAFAGPILFRDETIGVLSVLRAEPRPYFNGGEIGIISTVAEFLGIARTLALSQERRQVQQRTERELEIAAEVQRSLLPKCFPNTGKLSVFGISQTAEEVGGDYFDVLPIGDQGVLLVVADVMGKGMPAALLAAILRTAIRAHAGLAEDPGRLLTVVNRQLRVDLRNLGMFITAQIAFFSAKADGLIFASAGHCPLLKLSPSAACVSSSSDGGVPLGVTNDADYKSMRVAAARGDRFIFLTDGLYEAESASGQVLGFGSLARDIPALCAGDPRNCCARMLDYVARYSAGVPASDDRTLLITQCL